MTDQTLLDATRYVLAHFDGSEDECDDCALLETRDEQPCSEHAVLADLRSAFLRETGVVR